jgi:hypothetical protein
LFTRYVRAYITLRRRLARETAAIRTISPGIWAVSDQANNDIVKASLSAPLGASQAVAPTGTFVQINSPDLMAVDTGGTLHTKCNISGLCRIAPNGTISVLANDFQDARGVAVDAPRGRLYAIDRAAGASGTRYVRTFPLN